MSLKEEFQEMASEIIAEFCEPNGVSTIKSHDVVNSTYNDTTGVYTKVYNKTETPYIAFGDIKLGAVILGNRYIEMDPGYLKDYEVAYVAGKDITFKPKTGDVIIPAGDTTVKRIAEVNSDMYDALYICYLHGDPNGA